MNNITEMLIPTVAEQLLITLLSVFSDLIILADKQGDQDGH